MRFDDRFATVLAADTATPAGARAAWRQLVDLVARGRVEDQDAAIDRLRAMRDHVPRDVRASSARAAAFATPPAALVALFAEEDVSVAAPLLRIATLPPADWLALLPILSPAGRAVLRHRRDLPDEVSRGLESFGSVDFVIEGEIAQPAPAPAPPEPLAVPAPAETAFVSLASAARGLPIVAEALRIANDDRAAVPQGPFAIADLVARIDAYTRRRETTDEAAPDTAAAPLDGFVFETDARGALTWVEGAPREPLIGLSLTPLGGGEARVDGGVHGAFQRRQPFRDSRLTMDGGSPVAGDWRIAGEPIFEPASGRFIGYRCSARRPRRDERAEPGVAGGQAELLRQLVHELRTPTNAIAGFAEMIESEMLGEVAPAYRGYAGAIRREAADLIGAIDDIDLAARIDMRALDLRPGRQLLAPLIARILADLEPLMQLRGAGVTCAVAEAAVAVDGDARAIERLLARLLAALVAAAARGETIALTADADERRVTLAVSLPRAVIASEAGAGEAAAGDAADGPLLGTGFALRLARNLAVELGGSLRIGSERLTLRLPIASPVAMGQATIS